MSRGLLSYVLGEHVKLETQKTFGDTRVDFVLHHEDGRWFYRALVTMQTCISFCAVLVFLSGRQLLYHAHTHTRKSSSSLSQALG